jgi:hypothetical protein
MQDSGAFFAQMFELNSNQNSAHNSSAIYVPYVESETLPETIESGPLCITDLFQNKSVAYF